MGLASFATASMLGMGEVARRIVGIAYYNEKTDEVGSTFIVPQVYFINLVILGLN